MFAIKAEVSDPSAETFEFIANRRPYWLRHSRELADRNTRVQDLEAVLQKSLVSRTRAVTMFGRRKLTSELDPPPIATGNREAVEILRVWAAPGAPQQLTLRTCWKDPGAWGLLLADVARHAAQAYQRDGQDCDKALQRIRELFEAEWSSPTTATEDLTDQT